ncbi:DUF5134 domain-containing protein [Streptomyces sp. CT34]|uniref:DUF5134 domain-containing protein n=1 Tax=Streptomyces sp. CT34 TaxID=1553907 RepID=UPI0005B89995|nr:DUF5134 domain-containing protein [Streptomyces sp. CT34]
MHTPPLVGWLLVLLYAAAGVYCLTRMRAGPAAVRTTARAESLMAGGMAVMALPASAVAPPAWLPWLFTAVFGTAGLWALARRHLHHAVGMAAMVYMALAMAGMGGTGGTHGAGGMAGMAGAGGMAGMGGTGGMAHAAPAGVPLLTGVLLAYYTVYVIAAGIRLTPATGTATEAPVVLRACQVAMGIGMLAMLLAL